MVPNWHKIDQNLVQKGQNHIYRPREQNKSIFPSYLKSWSWIYIPNTKICFIKVQLDPRKGSKGSKIDLKWSKKSKRFWLVNMDLRWDNNFLTWRYKNWSDIIWSWKRNLFKLNLWLLLLSSFKFWISSWNLEKMWDQIRL